MAHNATLETTMSRLFLIGTLSLMILATNVNAGNDKEELMRDVSETADCISEIFAFHSTHVPRKTELEIAFELVSKIQQQGITRQEMVEVGEFDKGTMWFDVIEVCGIVAKY